MAALTFDKNELGNLEYSLKREMLATDRRGGYMSTTIVGCNTRKYHGLIVAPIDESDREFVLLSSLDETVVLDGFRFNLALHRFNGGNYEPRGHKYITDFEYTPAPTITYRVGDVVLRKELLWIHKRTQLMVKYTLVESSADSVNLQLRPFLAFRSRHALSKANMYADGRSYEVACGVKSRLYENFPWLYMQCNRKDVEFVSAPDWYYDFEYQEELDRGYEGHEDLLTTGYFDLQIAKGESVVFSASTEEMFSADTITEMYNLSSSRRTEKVDFHSCLRHAARQFVVRRPNNKVEVIAGYPWYGVVGREALISLPGLTLEQGHKEDCIDVINSLINDVEHNDLNRSYLIAEAVDTQLLIFRVLQELEKEIGQEKIWADYSTFMKGILVKYINGVQSERCNVSVHENGLVWAWANYGANTWMDTTIDAADAPARNGYHVEVNALWYNAICYTLALAEKMGDSEFVAAWGSMPEKIKGSFNELFVLSDGTLADFVGVHGRNESIRSNMILAASLDYKMISEEQCVNVIRTIQQHLLTPKGLRSLSPRNPLYGVPVTNSAAKNGSVWVWPIAPYVKACFDVMGDSFLSEAERILEGFEDETQSHGIGSVSEYYDADPPHQPHGAISQAWSVAAVLEVIKMVEARKAAMPKKRAPRVAKPKAAAAPKAAAKKSTTKRVAKPKVGAAAAPKKRATRAKKVVE
ncbi:MAG: glycogen debranching enzyme N-terminal domain-containing protein [Rikenellaceae bacterium]